MVRLQMMHLTEDEVSISRTAYSAANSSRTAYSAVNVTTQHPLLSAAAASSCPFALVVVVGAVVAMVDVVAWAPVVATVAAQPPVTASTAVATVQQCWLELTPRVNGARAKATWLRAT